MMADHINIMHPQQHDQYQPENLLSAKIQQTELALRIASNRLDAAIADLESIFARIDRGQTVELHYPDGRKIVIKAYKADKEAV